jgi:two-component sensor histidine kinase
MERVEGFVYRKIHNPNTLFWLLNISGWGLYWFFICFMHASAYSLKPRLVLWAFLMALTGCLLCLPMRMVYRRIPLRPVSLPLLFAVAVVVVFITGTVWYGLDLLTDKLMKTANEKVYEANFKNFLMLTFYWDLLLFAWSALYFVIRFWMEWDRQRHRTHQAHAAANQAQLQMLRIQLNPHFLFNSLNSVRALIDEDEENAKVMVTELSEFLRHSLVGSQAEVPLRKEIEALKHYFAIEKRRYEDKLEVAFHIHPEAEEVPVIGFLIHPLAENAVKYGMQTSPMPLKIEIKAEPLDGGVVVKVYNTGKWKEPGTDRNGTQTGLDNIRQRLQSAYPGRHRFEITQHKGWVRVYLEIQKEGEEASVHDS